MLLDICEQGEHHPQIVNVLIDTSVTTLRDLKIAHGFGVTVNAVVSPTKVMNKIIFQWEWKISYSHSWPWEWAWEQERCFVSSFCVSWSSKEISLGRKKTNPTVSKLWAGFWRALKGKVGLDSIRDTWQGTFADSDWSCQWEWHWGEPTGIFKTCSVNSDVKEAREDIKDMEGTRELLPKVRFLDAMTCFCQVVLK